MVSLGFFTIGGQHSSASVPQPGLSLKARAESDGLHLHRVAPAQVGACMACLRTESRCDAVLPPWRAQCEAATALQPITETGCCVDSFVGLEPAMFPALAACASVCSLPHEEHFSSYSRDYARPFSA